MYRVGIHAHISASALVLEITTAKMSSDKTTHVRLSVFKSVKSLKLSIDKEKEKEKISTGLI